jgi:hypothetical protein
VRTQLLMTGYQLKLADEKQNYGCGGGHTHL